MLRGCCGCCEYDALPGAGTGGGEPSGNSSEMLCSFQRAVRRGSTISDASLGLRMAQTSRAATCQ